MTKRPFWKTKPLDRMTRQEWESLCDRCGLCCLNRFEDKKTGKIFTTFVSCEYLDLDTCQCVIYKTRFNLNPECLKLRAGNIKKLTWLPLTCAYRIIAEGRDLEWWHPLISGDPETVHKAGKSVLNKAVSEAYIHPEDLSP